MAMMTYKQARNIINHIKTHNADDPEMTNSLEQALQIEFIQDIHKETLDANIKAVAGAILDLWKDKDITRW